MSNIYNFAALPPEAPKEADISGALALLVAIGDKSTKATLEKLQAAAAEHRDAAAAAETALAELDRKTAIMDARVASVDADLAQLRSEAEKRMDDERKAFDADIAGRLRDLEKRERQVAAADEKYLQLNAALEHKLEAIKMAVK